MHRKIDPDDTAAADEAKQHDEALDEQDPQPGHHDSNRVPVTEYRGVELDPATLQRDSA